MRMARLKNRPAKRIYRSQRICKGPIKGSLFCRVLVNNTHHTNMTGPSFKLIVHRAIKKKWEWHVGGVPVSWGVQG